MSDFIITKLYAEIEDLKEKVAELEKENAKLSAMIENGLGFEDMERDV